eukprot:4846466-Amphidinium_carterae.1
MSTCSRAAANGTVVSSMAAPEGAGTFNLASSVPHLNISRSSTTNVEPAGPSCLAIIAIRAEPRDPDHQILWWARRGTQVFTSTTQQPSALSAAEPPQTARWKQAR